MEERSITKSTTLYESQIKTRGEISHCHDFHDGILMFSRYLTLVTPSFTNCYLNFIYPFCICFFVIFGYGWVCEWLVPITMYGDENKDGQITIQDKKSCAFLDGSLVPYMCLELCQPANVFLRV